MSKTSGPYRATAVERESERMRDAMKNPSLWEIRDKDEAKRFWKEQYPFMNDQSDKKD